MTENQLGEPKPIDIKPGQQTTEFYVMLASMIVFVLKVFFGTDVDQDIIVTAITGIVGVAGVVMYIWSRVQLKKQKVEAIKEIQVTAIENNALTKKEVKKLVI